MKNKNFSDVYVDKRYWFVALTIILVAITCIGLPTLKFNPDLKAYIDQENPYLISLNAFEEKYASTDNVFILLNAKTGEMTDTGHLTSIEEVTQLAKQLPYAYRVESISNYSFIETQQDELKVLNLKDLTQEGLIKPEQYREWVMKEPLLVNRLITDNARVALVHITFNLPEKRSEALPEVLKALETLRENILKNNHEIDMYLGGGVIVEAEMAKIIANDNMIIIPLMFLVGFLVNVYLLRSFACYFAGLTVINLAVLSALGLTAWYGHEVTNVSSMGFMLIIVLATADTVHLTSNYVANLRQGMEKYQALKNSISSNIRAIVLTNITTVIGFLSLNITGAPQFAAMGNIGAIGILLALLYTFTVYPAFLLLFNVNPPKKPLALTNLSEKIARFAIGRHNGVLVTSAVVILSVGAFVFNLNPNEDPYNYFKPNTENGRTIAFVERNVKAQKYVYVDINAGAENAITGAAFLQGVETLDAWLKTQPEVVHVFSYLDVLKKLNKVMKAEQGSYRLPENQALTAQYLLAYEMSLSYGQDLSDFMDTRKTSIRMVVATEKLDNDQMMKFVGKLQAYLKQQEILEKSSVTGMDVVNADHGLKSLNGMIGGDLLTMLLVTLVIIAILKSLRYGLLSLVPNLAAPVFLYGLWGMISENLTMAAIATFSVCFGIIVDDTLHLLVKYIKHRKAGESIEDSIKASLLASGPAIVVTTLIFSLGAALLGFSQFIPNAEVGYIMTPMILFALFIELLIFPGLIIKYEALFGKEEDSAISAAPASSV